MTACAFGGRSRTPEPTLTTERWFLSVCYRKTYSGDQASHSIPPPWNLIGS